MEIVFILWEIVSDWVAVDLQLRIKMVNQRLSPLVRLLSLQYLVSNLSIKTLDEMRGILGHAGHLPEQTRRLLWADFQRAVDIALMPDVTDQKKYVEIARARNRMHGAVNRQK